jgi:hypothetical protein
MSGLSGVMFSGITGRGMALLVLAALGLAVAPFVADRYLVSVLTTVLWFAYVGQAWNVMMGFSGLLSLGHALYVGLGAYVSAALFVHFGIGPWAGMVLAMLVAVVAGCVIGFLGFRFGVKGVHFALLTIAFAEVARIGFDHITWVGGSGGFFLPVEAGASDPLNLRGSPVLFYYVALALVVGALFLSRALLHSRLGYQWLAVREEPDAAEASGVGGGVLRPDRAGRRVPGLLFQQPVPGAGLLDGPVHRDHPAGHRRRHRHAGRPNPGRLHPDAAGRGADLPDRGRRAGPARPEATVLWCGAGGDRSVPAGGRVALAGPPPASCPSAGGGRLR